MVEIDGQIAQRLKSLRGARPWTLDQLADASGVSRGMLSKIERGEVSATAALLSRVAAALEVPLSDLLAAPEVPRALQRRADRPRWQDPETGFVRETASPPLTGSAVEIVEVELPPHARVDYRMPAPAQYSQHLLVLSGTLRLRQREQQDDLARGDALYMVPIGDFSFENPGASPCRYLVVMERPRRSS